MSDYYLSQYPEGSLVQSLRKRGWNEEVIRVLPLPKRSDWLQVFWKGAFDPQFWAGQAPPIRPAFAWYLQRIANTIQEMRNSESESGSESISTTSPKIILIGHSAGGWLARAALGYLSQSNGKEEASPAIPLECILGLVTLGAPHLPPPPQIMDMTRGALRITNEQFPGAYYQSSTNEPDSLFYLTVMGDAVRGVQQVRKSPWEPTVVSGFAYNSYEAVCGQGDVTGDGVVPLESGHLDQAKQLTLPGIFHSINRPDQWYGSDNVIDSWHDVMLELVGQQLEQEGSNKKQPWNFDFWNLPIKIR
ncbi:hypothetical protein FisN_14Hh380 [Fistulifera solaris]|uniref:GPI inositol-deacylase n=1 Tax=Fistulifera solaris TaxID=1519565 RepID=A0A1Z5K4M5_FISSO|nr:hypothetical protein FisN_14Hh380 [Fistulifera solaris]|eukprot:GAX21169.1 hypothetical protein FisN_14Hh380 [Fistulifera solaris]